MQALLASVLRGALLTGLYFAGAVITVLYLRTPADVTLFWPAAGIGYAAVLRYGLKQAPTIAIAQLLLHLFVVPVPSTFLLFSVASNSVATVLACAYVQYRRKQLQFRINDGLLLLRGGLLLGATVPLIWRRLRGNDPAASPRPAPAPWTCSAAASTRACWCA